MDAILRVRNLSEFITEEKKLGRLFRHSLTCHQLLSMRGCERSDEISFSGNEPTFGVSNYNLQIGDGAP